MHMIFHILTPDGEKGIGGSSENVSQTETFNFITYLLDELNLQDMVFKFEPQRYFSHTHLSQTEL